MKKSKLVELLGALSEKEIQQFSSFVDSYFVNTDPRLGRLLHSLISSLDKGKPPVKEKVYKQVFGDESYDDSRLRQSVTGLYALARQFLAWIHIREQPGILQLSYLREFRERDLERLFRIEHKAVSKSLTGHPQQNSNSLLLQYHLAAEANAEFGKRNVRVFDNSLQEMVDCLDSYYLTIKLKESCEMLNRQTILSEEYDLQLLEPITNWIDQNPDKFSEQPAILVYRKALRLLSGVMVKKAFFELKSLLPRHAESFAHEDLRGLYKHLMNFCIRAVNKGEAEFLKELFALYRATLDNGVIYTDQKLAHTDFKNIVTTGLKLREFDWVEQFILSEKNKVPAEHRENVFNIALANYYAATGQLDKAVQLLQSVQFTDVYYDITARNLLLQFLYDSDDFSAAHYHLDAFRIFLMRNREISAQHRLNHLNFVKFARKMLRMKEKAFQGGKTPRKEKKLLRKETSEAKNLSNKKWLTEKLDEL